MSSSGDEKEREEVDQNLFEYLAALGYSIDDFRGDTVEEKIRSLMAFIQDLLDAGHVK